MLSLLHIENIAVIEAADISFERGFNVLTGETGAGKSIVNDSIGAALWERTSGELLRTGARRACVEAVFSDLPPLPWFQENGVEPDENGELLLRRELYPDGKNVCRAGGRLLTVAQLRQLGRQLLNIHGQHEGQALLEEERHLDYLDRFAGSGPLLEEFRLCYGELAALRREMDALRMSEGERARRIDSLEFQISELERAGLKSGEEEALLERRAPLRPAEPRPGAVPGARRPASGDDERQGAAGLLADAQYALSRAGQVSRPLGELAEQLEQLRLNAEDLAGQVRDFQESFDFSPGELDEIEGRLEILSRLRKKYGATVEDMLGYLEASREELERLQQADDTLSLLEPKLEEARERALERGRRLSEHRVKAARNLEERIQGELEQLDMPRVRFSVQLCPKDGPDGMDAAGLDQVRFLMSANVGEDLKPIAKIASGGELARIMLAMKSVLAESDEVGALIFDEVDAGVSGRAARKVAEKMADIARSRQVLCVTHLPQIAAMADVHFSVEKGVREGRTFTSVERLDWEGRRAELARLTGGGEPTALQLESAGQLLEQAQAYRRRA
ncbi:MAG: DNA repair protein RecN [Oscillospiraceae bacterium]|nr:DNA repair protein RecN [Oscillospiraceae bacterium]